MANAPLTPLEAVLSEEQSLGLPDFKFDKVERAPSVDTRQPAQSSGKVPADYLPLFESEAKKYNVPVNVLLALGDQESKFNPKAIGPKTEWGHAKGMMQYLDSTAAGLGINAYDPQQAIGAAARQIRERLDKGYSMEDAVKEHFAGPNRKQWGAKTAQYGVDVMGKAAKYGETYQPSGVSVDASSPQAARPGQSLDLAGTAPSPLTVENQNAYKRELVNTMLADLNKDEPGRFTAPTPEQLASASTTALLPGPEQAATGQDGFLSATGKALGNIPQNFQNSAGGLIRYAGEEMSAEKERSLGIAAQKLGMSLDDAKLIYWAETNKLIPDDLKKKSQQEMLDTLKAEYQPDQKAVQKTFEDGGIFSPQALAAAGAKISKSARDDMTKINPNGPMAKYGSMIISSTAEMIPALVAGALTKNPNITLGMIGGQVYGSSYETGREKLNPQDAARYALAQAAAEAIPSALPVHAILKPGANFFKHLLTTGGAEAIQEGITGALQAGIDKGTIKPEMTWAEAQQQIVDSMIVGAGAGVSLGAGSAAVKKVADGSKEKQLGKAMGEAVDQAEFATSPQQEAIQALDPNTQQQAAPAPVVVPPVASGPLGRAMERVQPVVPAEEVAAVPVVADPVADPVVEQAPAVETSTPAADEFMGATGATINVAPPGIDPFQATIEGYTDGEVILRDQEGNRFQVSRDELQTPEQAEQVQEPVTDPVQEPAAAIEVPVPALEVEQQQRTEPKTYEQMDEPELRARLKYLGNQAKGSGWNSTLTRERAKVEKAINNLATTEESSVVPDPVAETPAADAQQEPAKWFGSQEKAAAYVAKKGLAGTHEVKQNDRRFEVVPKAAPAVEVAAATAPVQKAPADKVTGHVNRARKLLGAEIGDTITPSADVGYSTAGTEYVIESIAKNGDVHVVNQSNGSRTSWSRADMERASRSGTTFGKKWSVDAEAQEAATSPKNDLPDPTDAQREAGNYKMAHTKVAGLDVTIEIPAGGKRRGTDSKGKAWERELGSHYGYIKRTKGADGENVDVYLGPKADQVDAPIYVIDQNNPNSTDFDEHKVMMGFGSSKEAEAAFRANFPKGMNTFGAMKKLTPEQFKAWLRDGDLKQPIASYSAAPTVAETQTSKTEAEQAASETVAAPAVSENKVFTEDAAAKARALLKSKLTQLNSGIDPEIMQAGITLAGYHIEKGARTFAAYAKAMAADLGDAVRPYLKSWYMGVKYDPRATGFDGMSTAAEVEAFDINKPIEEGVNESAKLDQPGAGALEGAPAREVRGAEVEESAGERPARSGRTDARRDERTGSERTDDARSVGDDQAELSLPAGEQRPGRAASERQPVQRGDGSDAAGRADGRRTDDLKPPRGATAEQRPVNFTITAADAIGQGGAKTKYKANVEAIRLLKQLESEGRFATRDEQAALAKYVGWGGIPQAFERSDKSASKGWEREVAEMRELLTPEEYSAAASSTKNAHYTSPEIVAAMWRAADRLGFNGGRVLEPSVGAGNFFGMMPHELRKSSALNGVELDRLTSGIAAQLYPEAKIARMGFQDYLIPDGHFDLAIGNPPFGRESLYDGKRKDLNGFSIHNYFFAKSLDGLKPGGVLAMVVTNRMMDVPGDKARSYMDARADFLGAIRLPNDAFMANAGTSVTTDIIFMRKRGPGELPDGESWTKVEDYQDKDGKTVPLNEYFVRHPEMMLGEFGAFGSMYREGDAALVARDGQDTAALLDQAIARLPEKAAVAQAVKPETAATVRAESVRVGSMFMDGNTIKVRGDDVLGENTAETVTIPNEKAGERITGMIRMRDQLAKLRTLQLNPDATIKQMSAARKALNEGYDAFVKEHGPINADANKRLFRDDPTWPQLSALEDGYDKGISAAVAKKTGEEARKPSAQKSAIFTKRTQAPYKAPESAASAKDAMVSSLAETGRVDLPLMQRLYGKPAETIIKELGDLVYQDPAKGFVTSDEYLSGNVKAKLAQARESAKTDPAFARNIEALEAVQPADIEAVDINVKPGATWVPQETMGEFANHIAESTGGRAVYNPSNAKWSILDASPSAAADQRFATSRVTLRAVLEAAANQKTMQVFDTHSDGSRTLNETETQLANDRVRQVKEEWSRWVWGDDTRREKLSRLYNDIFNTNVPREYDGSHLSFPGKVGDDIITLRPHQGNAVWRIIQSDTTLTDHVVGAGKTFTLVAAAMELRRMGLAKKPMFAVPNHLVGQWAADFTKLYPGANILAATKKDFEANNRKRLFARIATGDWDAVIVAHSSFGKVEVEPKEQAAFIEEQIADMDASIEVMRQTDGEKSRNVKDVQKRRDALREKLKKLLDADNKDDSLYWGELGIDALFLDEAHEFKNLAFSTSMSRVAGLGNQQGSQKASDMFLKVRQVLNATGGRNVTFATGTPISNTMAEMFTMQRYLDYKNLKAQGISHFDGWARMFGEVVTDWELSPSGKYKMNSRFAKFVNMPELMQRYTHFADVINRDDINRMLAVQGKKLPVPKVKGGKPQNVVVERSPAQAAYIGVPKKDAAGNDTEDYPQESLVYRSENLPKKAEKGADNMLKVMGDARKAALDMRLIDPSYPDFPGSKVNVSADNIKADYDASMADRGVQLVFIDLSTPKNAKAGEAARLRDLVERAEQGDEAAIADLDKVSPDELMALDSDFSVYDDLKQKLIGRGIPEAEIAFIHDAKTELQKEELFGKVRSGRIRVFMGSTAKMGAGMNVQDRLVSLHHLDAPWRPSDLEQREGRIIRQGNKLYERDPENFEVGIYRYATKQTLDSRMWQTIEGKANFIEQVRKGNTGSREIEDVGGEAANSAEMKAASSGNPMILEEMSLRQKVRKLETERQGHDREQHRLRDSISSAKRRAAQADKSLAELREDAKRAQPKDFEMTVDGQVFDKRKDAGEAILAKAADMEANKTEEAPLGKFGDFDMHIERIGAERYVVSLNGAGSYEAAIDIGADPLGAAMRVTNTVKDLSGEIEYMEGRKAKAEKDIPQLEAQVAGWSKSQDLKGAQSRHADVLEQLKPKKTVQTAPIDGDTKASLGDSASLGETLRASDLGGILGKLVEGGQVVLHDTAPEGVHPQTQGWTDADGKMHLVADQLTAENAQAVLLHEAFHSGSAALLKSERWSNLMARLNGFYKAAEEGRMPGEWADAFRRVQKAQQAGDTMSRLRSIEELGAYAIENYERAPNGIKKWADGIMGMVKDWLYRRFGIQAGAVTPGQLRALSVAALRDGRASSRLGEASSRLAEKTDSPAFKRWFGDSQVVDANGDPLVVYHGTANDFSKFSDEFYGDSTGEGDLGEGFYFTDRAEVASSFAQDADGDSPNVMPVYLAIKNPATNKDINSPAVQDIMDDGMGFDSLRDVLTEQGFDGIMYKHKNAGTEIVAFRPEQIKSAVGNNGKFDPENADIRYSVKAPSDPEVEGWFSRKLTDAMAGAKSKGQFSILAVAPMDRMIEELAGDSVHATEYLRLKRDMDAYRAKKHAQFDATAQKWLKLNVTDRAGSKEMARIMHDATLAQTDPAEGFTTILTRLDEQLMSNNVDSEAAQAAFQKKAQDERRKVAHGDLSSRFKALSPELQAHYRAVRDTYKQMTEELDQILMDNMADAIDLHGRKAERIYDREIAEIRDDGLAGADKKAAEAAALSKYNSAMTKLKWNKKARLTAMRQQFEANRLAGPYFPLARFGDYFVTVRDTDSGEVISFSRFENRAEQLKFAADAKRLGKVQTGLLSNDAELRGSVDPRFVSDIEDILGGSGVPDTVKDQVWQRYLESMPDMSMRKGFIHRKNREGYTQDALRAFASRMFHGAHQLGRLKFGAKMQDTLDLAKDMAGKSKSPERDTAVMNELNRRHEYVMNPKGGAFAQRLTSAAFIYHLSMSPAAALVNLSQTVILGIPIIGAKFGMAKTNFEMGRALTHFVRGKGHAENSTALTADENKAMRQAYESGLIESTQSHNLAGVGETGVEYSAVRNKVMGVIAWMFHQTERLNREVTFLSVYRLARKSGMAHEQSVDEGARLTYKTHFDYANTNRPRAMHGDVAKVALVFRNYQVNMLWRLFRDTHQVFQGDKAARTEAVHQLAGITGMMALNAGIKGVWLYGIAMAIASMIFGDDAEDEFKKGTVNLLGKTAAGLLLNGIPGHVTGTSLSGRIGMPDLWFRSPDRQLEGKDEFNYWQSQLLGALPGIAQNMFMGSQQIMEGKTFRGVETIAPKSVKDLMRAYRFANEGATTMRGDPLVSELKPNEVAAQMMGFTPAVVAEQYERNSSLKNAEKRIMDERRGLMDKYAMAHKLKDTETKAEALDAIKVFNRSHKEVAITPQTIQQSLRARNRFSERTEGGVTLNPKLDKKLRGDLGEALYK